MHHDHLLCPHEETPGRPEFPHPRRGVDDARRRPGGAHEHTRTRTVRRGDSRAARSGVLQAVALAAAASIALMLAGCAAPPPRPAADGGPAPGAGAASAPAADVAVLAQQVILAEAAFAKTMADRDHAAFVRFVADDAVFFTGQQPLRGKAAVAAGWKRFFDDPKPAFSWAPGQVQVLDSGTLALSTGPVFDAAGAPIASFTSIWRQESPGVWKVVFDKGCNCP